MKVFYFEGHKIILAQSFHENILAKLKENHTYKLMYITVSEMYGLEIKPKSLVSKVLTFLHFLYYIHFVIKLHYLQPDGTIKMFLKTIHLNIVFTKY